MKHFALSLFFLILCPISILVVRAEEKDNAEEVRYILTSQEKLYEGIPENRGDSWLIKLPGQTGGLMVSKLDVIFIGKSRDDVFNFQKEKLPPGNYSAVAALAEWGTRNQLTDRSLELLKDVIIEADPETRIVLQRQIDRFEYVENLKKNAENRHQDSASSHSPRRARTPEMQRLEEFRRHVPITVQDAYARKIQPILLSRCALSDCHQIGTSNRDLLFVKPDKRTIRQGNLLNLEQILLRVDLTEPTRSPILTHPEIIDSNGQQIYPFGNDANTLRDYKLFTQWITSLGKKVKPLPYNLSLKTPNSPKYVPDPIKTPTTPLSIYSQRPVDLTNSSDEPNVPQSPKHQAIPSVMAVSNLDETKFRDEFDPEPFNRKYHPNVTPVTGDHDGIE